MSLFGFVRKTKQLDSFDHLLEKYSAMHINKIGVLCFIYYTNKSEYDILNFGKCSSRSCYYFMMDNNDRLLYVIR